MAIIIGQSGAWKEIVLSLQRWDLSVDNPSDIQPLLDRINNEYQPLVEQKKLDTAQRIVDLENKIVLLRSEKRIFRKIINWFKIRQLDDCIIGINVDERQYISKLDRRIEKLKNVLQLPELAGSEAELEVIQALQCLPDEYIIFNNVHLRASKYIKFNDKYLLSAQIDHIVLSPFGVFIIETKRWSKEFAQSGGYHNPYDQVQRSSYLCYKLLKERFGKVRVRSIIAHQGALPTLPADAYIKVLRLAELLGYIQYFKNTEIESETFSRISNYLRLHVW
jgi:hypothetical protein